MVKPGKMDVLDNFCIHVLLVNGFPFVPHWSLDPDMKTAAVGCESKGLMILLLQHLRNETSYIYLLLLTSGPSQCASLTAGFLCLSTESGSILVPILRGSQEVA